MLKMEFKFKYNSNNSNHFSQFISVKLRKIKENNVAQFPKFYDFIGQKTIFRRYYIKNVEDGIQIQV